MLWNINNRNSPSPIESRRFFNILTTCLAFQTIGGSLLYTIFARKINTLGSGLDVFGFSATAFSFAALVAAPIMGMVADRFGRRILLLSSLISQTFAALGYLLASSGEIFIGIRAAAGALTAGLIPTTMSMIADMSPTKERGRWIGYVTGVSAIGYILGPALGGSLYDRWGLEATFLTAMCFAFIAFTVAFTLIPETSKLSSRTATQPASGSIKTQSFSSLKYFKSFKNAIPRPYTTFLVLLVITFIAVFAWRFAEPPFHFYIYDDLGWTSARFGLIIGGYAVLYMVAETFLGRLSDRHGRKPILIVGFILHVAQYIALITTRSTALIALGVAFSGLGEGLFMPALNAFYLDVTPDQYRARVLGIKESVFSLAGLSGPSLVVLVSKYLTTQGILIFSGSLILLCAGIVPFMVKAKTSNEVLAEGKPEEGVSTS
jgi:MFS family permease